MVDLIIHKILLTFQFDKNPSYRHSRFLSSNYHPIICYDQSGLTKRLHQIDKIEHVLCAYSLHRGPGLEKTRSVSNEFIWLSAIKEHSNFEFNSSSSKLCQNFKINKGSYFALNCIAYKSHYLINPYSSFSHLRFVSMLLLSLSIPIL
jgi:hypothetical protein